MTLTSFALFRSYFINKNDFRSVFTIALFQLACNFLQFSIQRVNNQALKFNVSLTNLSSSTVDNFADLRVIQGIKKLYFKAGYLLHLEIISMLMLLSTQICSTAVSRNMKPTERVKCAVFVVFFANQFISKNFIAIVMLLLLETEYQVQSLFNSGFKG